MTDDHTLGSDPTLFQFRPKIWRWMYCLLVLAGGLALSAIFFDDFGDDDLRISRIMGHIAGVALRLGMILGISGIAWRVFRRSQVAFTIVFCLWAAMSITASVRDIRAGIVNPTSDFDTVFDNS